MKIRPITNCNKSQQKLRQIDLLETVTKSYCKLRQLTYYKQRQVYQKLRQILQIGTNILQIAITITNCNGHYKLLESNFNLTFKFQELTLLWKEQSPYDPVIWKNIFIEISIKNVDLFKREIRKWKQTNCSCRFSVHVELM